MAKKDGWTMFRAPKQDEAGWFILEEDVRAGTKVRHDYPDEATAQEAYKAKALAALLS